MSFNNLKYISFSVVLYLTLLSCGDSSEKKTIATDSNLNKNEKLNQASSNDRHSPNNGRFLSLTDSIDVEDTTFFNVVLKLLQNDMPELTLSNVDIYELYLKNIKGVGLTKILEGKLSSSCDFELPETYYKSFYLFVYGRNKNIGLIYMNEIRLLKLNKDDKENIAGGFFLQKGFGNFHIYSFDKNEIVSIFESEEPLYNFSYECESFENGYLNFENEDFNNDGNLDLRFDGIKNKYCEGKETGHGKFDSEPLESENIEIKYYLKVNGSNLSWQKQ